jgi:hypothetical protein
VSGLKKLDARSRYLLSQRDDPSAEAVPAEVGALIRGEAAFSEEQLSALREAGARIRTVAGDVLTATVATDSLERLADHPFVAALEVSQPLYPEGSGAPFAADVE